MSKLCCESVVCKACVCVCVCLKTVITYGILSTMQGSEEQ